MLHTVIETSLHPKQENVLSMTALLLNALKKAGRRTTKYFKLIQKTKDQNERIMIRSVAERDSREILLRAIGNSKLCEICDVTTENAWSVRSEHSYTLVLDALDGMNNFRLWIPNYAVSASILQGDNILFGAVYNPVLGTLYSAHKWKGTFRNGKPISVNEVSDISESTVAYIYEHRRTLNATRRDLFWDLLDHNIKRVMMDRSPSNNFCLLAEGKIEAVICDQESIFDFSAGKIIAEEAGAITNYMQNNNSKDTNNTFVTTNASPLLSTAIGTIFKRHLA